MEASGTQERPIYEYDHFGSRPWSTAFLQWAYRGPEEILKLMDHGAFADRLLTLPLEWQEDLKQKRLATVPVLANATNLELIQVFGHIPKDVWNLIDLARAIEKVDIRKLRQEGLGPVSRVARDLELSVVMKNHRKPLQLPKKTPAIFPKGPSKGSSEIGDKPKEKAQTAKRNAALECLWNAFLDLGNCGTIWTNNFDKDDYRVEAKDVITDGWIENTALSQHLATLELWISFSEEVKINWKTPDSVAVRTFFGALQGKGSHSPKETP